MKHLTTEKGPAQRDKLFPVTHCDKQFHGCLKREKMRYCYEEINGRKEQDYSQDPGTQELRNQISFIFDRQSLHSA